MHKYFSTLTVKEKMDIDHLHYYRHIPLTAMHWIRMKILHNITTD